MAFGSFDRGWDEGVGWKYFPSCPRYYKSFENVFFFAFFSGDDCRDQEEMHKIGNVSNQCWGCMLCYSQLEFRAGEQALPTSHNESRIAWGNGQH